MNILNVEERKELQAGHYNSPAQFFDAIEAAVIKRLAAGVSVEPAATMQTYPDGRRRVLLKGSVADCDAQWQTTHILYTATAIAAARVQAENEALRTDIAGWNSAMGEANADIEALRTANAKPRANIEKTGAMHTAVRNALMHHKLTSRPDGVIESYLIYAVLDCIKGEQG